MLVHKKHLIMFVSLIGLTTPPLLAQNNASFYNLQQTTDYALSHNPDLQIMQHRIEIAEAQLGQAIARFYPQISARLTYEHSDNPARAFGMIIAQRRLSFNGTDFNHPGGTDNYRPEITARYALFRGGQDYFSQQAATLNVDASQLDYSATRQLLIQRVQSTFYGFLAAVEAHKVTQRSIDAVKSELKQSRVRYQMGSALKSDVLSLEVQLAEAKDAEIRAVNTIELAKTSLKTLLGLKSTEAFDIDTHTDWTLPKMPAQFSTLLDLALNQRAEFKAAKKRLQMAKHRLSAAKGAFLPTADAYVSYGSDSKNLAFSTQRDNVTAGVVVEMNIFAGMQTSEAVKKAQQQVVIAEKQVTQMQLQIENQVKTAYLKLQQALDRVKVTQTSMIAADEALRMVKVQRQAGTVTVTRYIESEVARDRTYSNNIAARFDALRAKSMIDQAIGQ